MDGFPYNVSKSPTQIQQQRCSIGSDTRYFDAETVSGVLYGTSTSNAGLRAFKRALWEKMKVGVAV